MQQLEIGFLQDSEKFFPEQRLWAAALSNAILESNGFVGAAADDRRDAERIIRMADDWINSDDIRKYGIRWVCSILPGADLNAIRINYKTRSMVEAVQKAVQLTVYTNKNENVAFDDTELSGLYGGMSLNAKVKKALETEGYHVEVVEQNIRQGGNVWKRDLFNLFDILAVHKDGTVRAVQLTTRSNVSSRIRKILNSPILPALRKTNWKLEVWGHGQTLKNEWRIVDVKSNPPVEIANTPTGLHKLHKRPKACKKP